MQLSVTKCGHFPQFGRYQPRVSANNRKIENGRNALCQTASRKSKSVTNRSSPFLGPLGEVDEHEPDDDDTDGEQDKGMSHNVTFAKDNFDPPPLIRPYSSQYNAF